MINVHGLRRNVKNVVKNYSDAQVKVREATSNDPWGPSGTLMSDIADLTYNVVAFSEIMQVIWKRLNDHGKNWKHVYKALVLLEYLIKTGSEKVTQQCKENLFAIQTLKDFQYFEESKDQGINVREKAKQLVALLKDDERLKSERIRALKARERFARSSSSAKQDPMQHFGSSEFSPGPIDEDMLSPTAISISELEHVRPQTAGEEELQLQLALAMSKEDADQSERLKRNDDLRLQMALSESQEEFQKKRSSSNEQSASAVEDLLGLSLHTNSDLQTTDPWGLPTASSRDLSPQLQWNNSNFEIEQNHNVVRNDPWNLSSENIVDNRNLSETYLASDESELNAFDMRGIRKSMSADVCSKGGVKSLDALISSESSLIQVDPTSLRSRTLGNPFQAAKPSPMSINEIRAQNSFLTPSDTSHPSTTVAPTQDTWFANGTYPNQNTSQNPFM